MPALSPTRLAHRPKYKGKYCVGERKRLRLCNLKKCPAGHPSFRHVQCSHFDTTFYKGRLHTWVPVVNDGESCRLPGDAGPGCCALATRGPPSLHFCAARPRRPSMPVLEVGFLVDRDSFYVVLDGSCTWAPREPLRAALPARKRVLCREAAGRCGGRHALLPGPGQGQPRPVHQRHLQGEQGGAPLQTPPPGHILTRPWEGLVLPRPQQPECPS